MRDVALPSGGSATIYEALDLPYRRRKAFTRAMVSLAKQRQGRLAPDIAEAVAQATDHVGEPAAHTELPAEPTELPAELIEEWTETVAQVWCASWTLDTPAPAPGNDDWQDAASADVQAIVSAAMVEIPRLDMGQGAGPLETTPASSTSSAAAAS